MKFCNPFDIVILSNEQAYVFEVISFQGEIDVQWSNLEHLEPVFDLSPNILCERFITGSYQIVHMNNVNTNKFSVCSLSD